MTTNIQTKVQNRVRNFYRAQCGEDDPSSALIGAALLSVAENYRPNAFSTLKSQIVADLLTRGRLEAAEEIRGLINPVTAPGSCISRKPKPRSVRKVSKEDTDDLLKHFLSRGHEDEAAALVLARFLGLRPCEMRTITVAGNEVRIIGGKKSAPLHRGADRTVVLDRPKVLKAIKWAAKRMAGCNRTDTAIRDRFRKECRELWPRRKIHPTLKSFRHNFSSALKAAGGDSKTRAYLMGHQSEESHSVYGDRRSGDVRLLCVLPAETADLSEIRPPKKSPRYGCKGNVIGAVENSAAYKKHWVTRLRERKNREIER